MRNDDRLAASGEDIDTLVDRLTAYATRRIRELTWRGIRSKDILCKGLTIEAIVQTAFEKLLRGAKWREDLSVSTILMRLVSTEIANLVRSWENQNFRDPQPDENEDINFFDTIEDDGLTPLQLTIRSEDEDRAIEILEALGEGSIEQRIAMAIFNGARKRAEIVEDAEITTDEYDAARKRMRKILESDLIAKFRQENEPAQQ
ncbi:hypothetical protein [Pelagicoccus sp. SDUM812002]|uniref:hypothetical protein n=1 Tax=Pelagicoccus sp. SDUM812002 TaxID=3041266 RepID=UPI00280FB143|nr:hypothetical protein [Pelagicoccus sp. SDUM812002]MDQ8184266.1 hypothetical protein [Pelagicoccus sp. SDUM812002]